MPLSTSGGVKTNKIELWTETVKTVTNVSSVIATENQYRKGLIIQNLGNKDCFYSKSGAAVVDQNLMISKNGGVVRYDAEMLPTGAIEAVISAASTTTIIVSEGL